jgi:hypothetical protein
LAAHWSVAELLVADWTLLGKKRTQKLNTHPQQMILGRLVLRTSGMGDLLYKQGAPFPLFSLSSVTRLSEGSDPWLCVPTSQWVCLYRKEATILPIFYNDFVSRL